MPMMFSGDETCDVGREPVRRFHLTTTRGGYAFSGEVNWVRIDLAQDDHGHMVAPEDRFKLAMARQ